MNTQRRVPGGWYYHPYEMAICGFSGSGKTTLVEKLIAGLRADGRSVGFLKHDAHRFEFDKPGKDTYRAAGAGAAAVAIGDPRHAGFLLDNGPQGADEALLELGYLSLDLLLIEGNKRSAFPKLLLLDPRGEMDRAMGQESFEKVRALVYPAGEAGRAEGLAHHVPGARLLCRDDVEGILDLLREEWRSRIPPLKGLVLAGGRSRRMGRDKAAIRYRHGTSEARRTADLAAVFCDELCIVARSGQTLPADCSGMRRLDDRFVDFGPVGGILTAMSEDPAAAWLVLGCDLPLLEESDLKRLVAQRDPLALATAFATPGRRPGDPDLLPEPLVAIYEPKSRGRLLCGLMRGSESPRRALMLGGARLVTPEREAATYDANSHREYMHVVAGMEAE